MFDARVEIMAYSQERGDYNERKLMPIGVFYTQETESDGRENLYANHIVHENEVVFRVQYSDKIKLGMFVRLDGRDMKITSVHEEGRRKYFASQNNKIGCRKIKVEGYKQAKDIRYL